MTEDEAKTKWCPLVRIITDNGGLASNRWREPAGDITLCIGSACMAWREQRGLVTPCDPEKPPYVEGAGGYCGLAGRP